MGNVIIFGEAFTLLFAFLYVMIEAVCLSINDLIDVKRAEAEKRERWRAYRFNETWA